MKALTNNDGTKAKPINPYTLEVPTYDKHGNIDGGYIDDDYIKFEVQYPERFLTIPQQPNSVIEIEPETVWQFKLKADKWVDSSDHQSDIKHRFETREAYQPIEQPKEKTLSFDCLNCAWQSESRPLNDKCPDCGSIVYQHRVSTPELKEAAEKETAISYKNGLTDGQYHGYAIAIKDVLMLLQNIADNQSECQTQYIISKVTKLKIKCPPLPAEQCTQDNKRIVDDKLSGQLFSSFIKSLLDSGAYTITQLREKEPSLIKEAFEYWVNELPDYDFLLTQIDQK